MPITDFIEQLSSEGDEGRVRLRIERGRVVDFVVQYEAIIEGKRYPIVRYDGSHGRAHRDTLDQDGTTIQKDWLPEDLGFTEAVNLAREDIKARWDRYREAFLRRLT